MPLQLAYVCQFRCGFVRATKKIVERHEERCYKNPETKACVTCKHFKRGLDYDDYQSWYVYICERNFFKEPTEKNSVGLRINCEKWDPKIIRIIDVILHKNKDYTQTFVVLNRMPKFKYIKEGNWLKAEDSGFYKFYYYEAPSERWRAFAGRKFNIPLKNGKVIEANGQWWDKTPSEYLKLYSCGVSTVEELGKCNVFFGGFCFNKKILNDWLKNNEASNNYNKYCTGHKDFGTHKIISKW